MNGPLKFGDYTHEFMEREADMVLGGDISRLGRHTQTFINYVNIAAFMKMKKNANNQEIVLEGFEERLSLISAALDNLQTKFDAQQMDLMRIDKKLKNLEKELGS